MDEKLQELRDRLTALHDEAAAIPAKADDEKRDNTPEELSRVEALGVEMDTLRRAIDAREKLAKQKGELARPNQRRTEPTPFGAGTLSLAEARTRERQSPGSVPAEPRDGRLGFRNFGDFALSVRAACVDGGTQDRRLDNLAPTTYGSEASGSDGGFLVPPDFRNAIVDKVMGQDSLISRTDQLVTTGNRLVVPVDETEPWNTAGVRAFWTGEGGLKQQSKPQFRDASLKLDKLAALVTVTDELVEDAPALDAYLKRKTPVVIDYKITDAIVNGTGAGMPMGLLRSPSVVSVAKEANQPAGTVVFANLVKMWARMYGPCRKNAVWLMNQDVEPQLLSAYMATGNNGFPAFLPPGGLSQSPYGTLFGRPILPIENAKTVGFQGDVILADLTQYVTLTKTEKLRTDVSIHLFFDFDMTAYRFVMRVGGQPWWNAPVARANGSNALSWAVVLDDRT